MSLWVDALHTGECCHLLPQVPKESVHLCFTSPPYNCGIKYDDWNDQLPWEAYRAFIMSVFGQIKDLLVEGGRVAINVPEVVASDKDRCVFMPELYQKIMGDLGFLPRDVIVWVKQPSEDKFCGNNTKWGSWKSPASPCIRSFSEKIIVWSKGTHRLEGGEEAETDLTANEFKEYTKNVWFVPTNSCPDHPAVFPEDLAYRIIKLYSWVGNTVLDPFAGIGTTLIAAKKLRRRYLGFEISESYCRLANLELSKPYYHNGPTEQEALF